MPTSIIKTQGDVKWYDPKKGYGFILRTGAPQVFLHYSALRPEEAQIIKSGDRVEFSIEQTALGGIAKHVHKVARKKA